MLLDRLRLGSGAEPSKRGHAPPSPMRTYSGNMKMGTAVFIVAMLASTLVDAHVTAPIMEATNLMQMADAFVEQSASSDDVPVSTGDVPGNPNSPDGTDAPGPSSLPPTMTSTQISVLASVGTMLAIIATKMSMPTSKNQEALDEKEVTLTVLTESVMLRSIVESIGIYHRKEQ